MITFETSPVADLEPKLFWKHFFALSQIPRCSGNEKGAGDYIVKVAQECGLAFKRDDVGNVVVSKPGSAGLEGAPGVILQGHLDMVCEKNKGVDHDFSKDPLKLKLYEGGKLGAEGTSLGADNGVGVASALALMEDKSLRHGPLELLFTVDEERGLTGANALTGDFLTGRRLLNLDSEELGVVFVGCAGGLDGNYTLAGEYSDVKTGFKPFLLKVLGLRGGHSGLDIHEGRGSAIKLLGRFIQNLLKDFDIQVASFEGGTKRNAIPRESEAVVFIDSGKILPVKEQVFKWEKVYMAELNPVDPGVMIQLIDYDGEAPGKAFGDAFLRKLLDVIAALPHGVLGMSKVIEDLVETSTNLATVTRDADNIVIGLNHRSSCETALQAVAQSVESLARLAVVRYARGGGYPGWQPNMESEVLARARDLYKKLNGREFEVKAVHAGLECGIIGEKFPGMDMISFGPSLSNVHSPDERLEVASVPVFYKFLLALLEDLAK